MINMLCHPPRLFSLLDFRWFRHWRGDVDLFNLLSSQMIRSHCFSLTSPLVSALACDWTLQAPAVAAANPVFFFFFFCCPHEHSPRRTLKMTSRHANGDTHCVSTAERVARCGKKKINKKKQSQTQTTGDVSFWRGIAAIDNRPGYYLFKGRCSSHVPNSYFNVFISLVIMNLGGAGVGCGLQVPLLFGLC